MEEGVWGYPKPRIWLEISVIQCAAWDVSKKDIFWSNPDINCDRFVLSCPSPIFRLMRSNKGFEAGPSSPHVERANGLNDHPYKVHALWYLVVLMSSFRFKKDLPLVLENGASAH